MGGGADFGHHKKNQQTRIGESLQTKFFLLSILKPDVKGYKTIFPKPPQKLWAVGLK